MPITRRSLLQSFVLALTVVSTPLVLGFSNLFRNKRLRPPCALDEKDLLASCIKCGQCIQVCPVQALKPGDINDGFGVGVPFLDPRKQACDFSCDVIQCALACPTGALAYHKPEFFEVRPGARLPQAPVLLAKAKEPDSTLNMTERMGVARLSRPDACLALQGQGVKGKPRGSLFQGLKRYTSIDRWKPVKLADQDYDIPLCDLCVRECPIQGAIRLETFSENGIQKGRPVVTDLCVGCGTCEMMCPSDPAAIEIEARGVWT